jgi:hypothetical protein
MIPTITITSLWLILAPGYAAWDKFREKMKK